jgi:hypothetical protein
MVKNGPGRNQYQLTDSRELLVLPLEKASSERTPAISTAATQMLRMRTDVFG